MTERDEAEFIAREIARLTASETAKASEVVVFYRVNAQSRVIEEALVRRKLPYYIAGGLRFYDQREIKDLIAYLRVLLNPADAVSLDRMVGVPPRGIGARTVEAMGAVAEREGVTLFESMGRLETESKVALRIAKQASQLYRWLRELAVRAETMGVRAILDEIIGR